MKITKIDENMKEYVLAGIIANSYKIMYYVDTILELQKEENLDIEKIKKLDNDLVNAISQKRKEVENMSYPQMLATYNTLKAKYKN